MPQVRTFNTTCYVYLENGRKIFRESISTEKLEDDCLQSTSYFLLLYYKVRTLVYHNHSQAIEASLPV